MNTKTSAQRKYQEIINQVNGYMGFRQFPVKLQDRIRFFYKKKFMKTYFKEEAILETLSGIKFIFSGNKK